MAAVANERRTTPPSICQDGCALTLEVRPVAGDDGRVDPGSDGRDQGIAQAKSGTRLVTPQACRACEAGGFAIGGDVLERLQEA